MMKKIVLAVALILPMTSNAVVLGGRESGSTFMQYQGQSADATSSGTNSNDININQKLQIPPAPPAIPSNINQNVVCPVVSQGTKAFSTILGGVSHSGASDSYVNGICVCYYKSNVQDKEACMHNYACQADATYKKANMGTSNACPVEQE